MTSRSRRSLLLPALLTLTCTACEPDPPEPIGVDDSLTTPPPSEIDLDALTGANFADPASSPSCPLEFDCAPLPGEPTAALRAGECSERHFRVNQDGTRDFINEVMSTRRAGGRLTERTDDLGTTTLSSERGRLMESTFTPSVGSASSAQTTTYSYDRGRLARTEASAGDQIEREQEFTYDDRGRLLTSTEKRRSDGEESAMTFERSARVYRYDEGRSRDIYDDADFDSMVSERDTLLRTQRWDNEGRFERDDDALDELASSSYTYDDDGTLSSISTGSAEQSAPLYTFTYSDSEDARVESIGLDASDQALTFTRDEDARLTLVTLQGADDTPLYELELEGAGCERPVHTWIKTAARLARFPSETEE